MRTNGIHTTDIREIDTSNVDELMTMIVQAPTHAAALKLARQLPASALWELCDLAHATNDVTPTSRRDSLADRAVIYGRGIDPAEAEDMFHELRMPVPRWVRQAARV
jgi:hypothetical protein